jgi:Zn-dependent alcohol dehydrogenase
MKAAILHQPGTLLAIEEVQVAAPGPHEVLIFPATKRRAWSRRSART